MRLLAPRIWATKYFSVDCLPPEPTLRRWMKTGAVPGRKIGGTWYVDDDAWLANGDDLVARVLSGN